MYTVVQVKSKVPADFLDAGVLTEAAYIQGQVSFDDACKIVKRYYNSTEAVVMDVRGHNYSVKAPSGIFAQVMSAKGEYLSPEDR
jgi:hypothetical protein